MNKLKVLVSLVVMALCSGFAFADNPVEGKKYVADVMGIEALSIEFVTYSKCVVTTLEEIDTSGPQEGSYTVKGKTVTVTLKDETLAFDYDKKNDVLSLDAGNGIKLQLKAKKVVVEDPKAKFPKNLVGKTYAGEMMGMEFMTIEFKDKTKCVAKVASDFSMNSIQYQTIEGTYTYDNSNGDMTITMDGDTQEFKYNKARKAITVSIDGDLSLELFEKK